MKKLLLSLLFVLPLALFAQTENLFKAQENLIGTIAPDLVITHYLQNQSADTNYTSKFKVLEFWATWCSPCLKAVPHLNKLQNKFKDENIVFLSITYETPEKTAQTLEKIKFETVVVSDTTNTIHQNLRVRYKGTMAIPRTVLIDNQNRIVWYGPPNSLSESMIRKFLKGELKAKP